MQEPDSTVGNLESLHVAPSRAGLSQANLDRGDPWDRIQEIFLAASDLPLALRAAFLNSSCGADTGLRVEVESLLAADSTGRASLFTAIESEARSLLEGSALLGARLGAYRVIREIGHGGMGAVYLAERDDDEYHKQVAIKVVKRGMDTAEVLGRFRHERQILANLDHPYIARLIDAGTTPDGRPFFVMEHVEGRPIDIYCREEGLDLDARLRLFLRVCEAVSCAHRSLVVHRDLKPRNILVTAEGIPKLLDFGVAKLLTPGLDSGLTSTGFPVGPLTPEYASPEQVLGLPITTATDVYALGAVLYELLTATRAHRLTSSAPAELERVICSAEVPRPSTIVAKLDGDLDNIVLMAMRREGDRRYQSVDQLAEDIRRHLEGLPIAARQDSLAYRAGRFVRRHKLAFFAAALVFASLVAGVAVSLAEARQAEASRRVAERRLTQMVELANRSLFDVHSAIERLPGSTAARRQIVATTLQFLEGLSKDAGGDERLRYALSAAYSKIADVQGYPLSPNLGDTRGALANYEKSIQLIEPLLTRQPENAEFLLQKVVTQNRRALILERMGQAPRALEIYRVTLPAAEKLGRLRPGNVEARVQEPGIYSGMATAFYHTDSPEALTYSHRNVESLRSLLREFPNKMEVQLDLAGGYSQLGQILVTRSELAQALQNHRQSIALREAAVARQPADTAARRGLMISYANVADILGSPFVPNLGDLRSAREYYAKVVAIARGLAAADSNNRLAQYDLAQALSRYAILEPPPAERKHSLALLQEAQGILERLVAADPSSHTTMSALALVEEYAGHRFGDLGRPLEALAQYRRSLEICDRVLRTDPKYLSLTSQALADEEAISGLLAKQGEPAAARAMANQAIARAEASFKASPGNDHTRNYVAIAYSGSGSVEEKLGDCQAARAAATRALSEWQRLAASGSKTIDKPARGRAEATLKRCETPLP
jgi:tetratricopeptide (TPR) repeat protein